MGTNFDRRLTKLALSMDVCPQHGERLLCRIYDLTEDPLPAEQDRELTGYLERLSSVLRPLPVWGRCPVCRDFTFVCLTCCADVCGEERDWGPLSEAERERCIDLLDRTDLRLEGDRRSVNTYG